MDFSSFWGGGSLTGWGHIVVRRNWYSESLQNRGLLRMQSQEENFVSKHQF